MIPKIIHYCWLSNDIIPEELQVYVNSWKDKLSDYEFILWNFNRIDINISPWVKQAFEAKKYAFAADFIRLYAVYHYGGIYLDMDIEVIKPFDNLLDAEYMLAYEDNNTMTIEAGCFGAEKKSSIIEKCLNYYYQRKFIKQDGTYDMLPLPQILRDVCNKYAIDIHFFSSDYFTAKCFKTGIINVTDNTYCIHHFTGSWKSDEEQKSKKQIWDLYEKYSNDELILDLIKKYENLLDNDCYTISLKYLYKIIFKRTIKKIGTKLLSVLKSNKIVK